ncbi:MAG TPA: response regulator [Patescibacteria group bacterium]|nr:response regulator [Patescibacteria group bacterium]|tara:strand:+ start:2276 stop:2548 length:273 start_codon:yes stop_codon:yes gene_type:complete
MNKVNVLIVEDDISTAKLIDKILTESGNLVSDIAVSGEEAAKKAEKNEPDIVLMDVELGGAMDGIETVEKIKYCMKKLYPKIDTSDPKWN